MSRYRHKVWLHRSFVQNRNGFLQICLSFSITSVGPFKRKIGLPNRDLCSKCVFRNMTYCGKSGEKKKKHTICQFIGQINILISIGSQIYAVFGMFSAFNLL